MERYTILRRRSSRSGAARGRSAALCLAISVGTWLVGAAPAWADPAPTITTQPQIAFVDVAPQQGSFTAAADGNPAPTVQWEQAPDRRGPWTVIPGATDATLHVTASSSNFGNAFRAVFTNSSGTATSRPAKLISPQGWMHDLGSDIADVPLTELTIPGTHDMGTYGITNDSVLSRDDNANSCGYDVAICRSYGIAQTLDATQELIRGMRYFDLRVCGHSSVSPTNLQDLSAHPYTCHGLEGGALADIIHATRLFVDAHPGEVVILDVNHLFSVDPDVVAKQIEDELGSRMIRPQYCMPADPDQGTCAGDLTLSKIARDHLGSVIVNYENDGGNSTWVPDCQNPDVSVCPVPFQPKLDRAFYDRHPLLWGRADGPPSSDHGGQCTHGAAFPSCFGNVDTNGDAQSRALQSLQERALRGDSGANGHFQHFFVQFLQTTPDAGTIASDEGQGSLRGEAIGGPIGSVAFENGSNPLIGPAVLGCGETSGVTGTCFGQHRPENINILAMNFFEVTDYTQAVFISQDTASACTGSDRSKCPLTPGQQATVHCGAFFCWYTVAVHFDLARDAIAFDEYARTKPVVTISSPASPAATGWYNAASLGGQGRLLRVDVSAEDYKYVTGIDALDCLDGTSPLAIGYTGPTSASFMSLFGNLGEGVHQLDCRATDGAHDGLHGEGNRGGGPGSTPLPVSFRVDTTPPVIKCPTGTFLLNQPISTLDGTVTDATSGVANPTDSAPISTSKVGSFTATLTATDVAGNAASKVCLYTVSYGIKYLYDTTKQFNGGSTIPIKLQLIDDAGNNVSSASIAVRARTVTNTHTGTSTSPSSPGNSNPTNVFDGNSTGYHYELNTKGYNPSSYTLDFSAGADPITHHAPFTIN